MEKKRGEADWLTSKCSSRSFLGSFGFPLDSRPPVHRLSTLRGSFVPHHPSGNLSGKQSAGRFALPGRSEASLPNYAARLASLLGSHPDRENSSSARLSPLLSKGPCASGSASARHS